jgi:cytochrome c oxidase cbb3-type subunit 3
MTSNSEPSVVTSNPERPEEKLLDHAYDGIHEYDNPLPRWWVWIFAGSFFFSIAYFFHYHLSGNGESVAAGYEADMRVAREVEAKATLSQPVTDESLAKLMSDADLMKDGKLLFGLRCSPCHGAEAQGVIGPNLTDSSWIHGRGTLTDIYSVIDQGVAAKGMPAWGRQLSAIEVRKLAAFVGTQRGKSLPGKPPEGAVIAPL